MEQEYRPTRPSVSIDIFKLMTSTDRVSLRLLAHAIHYAERRDHAPVLRFFVVPTE